MTGRTGASAELAASSLLAGVGLIERQTALAILLGGDIARWEGGRCGPLRAGSAGILLVARGRVQTVASTEGDRRVVIGESEAGEVVVSSDEFRTLGTPLRLLALRDSILCRLDREQLGRLSAYPAVLLNLVAQCISQAEQSQASALRLAHRRVEDRVLLALRDRASRYGLVTVAGVRVESVPHRELARTANVTRQGATMALAQLEREGLVCRTGGDYLLPWAAHVSAGGAPDAGAPATSRH